MKSLVVTFAFIAFAALDCFAQEERNPNFLMHPNPLPKEIEVMDNVEIAKVGDKVLHAAIARPRTPSPKPLPAVIYVHGGGWKSGSEKGNGAIFLAGKGYFVASIEYRLTDIAPWPAQIEDCKLGVRWLRANAAKYNIDPDRIGCMGHSAGAHLVACLGTMDDPKYDAGDFPGVSSKVRAVVDADGPVDFVAKDPKLRLGAIKEGSSLVHGLLGGDESAKADVAREASPFYFVKAGDPPFLVLHGDKDTAVPYAQGVEFVDALKKAGVKVEFVTVKNGTHMLNSPPSAPPVDIDIPTLHDDIAKFFDQYLKG